MSTPDEDAIKAIVSRFADAWNRHDTRALAALFAEDADFVNRIGMWWKGRAQIEERQAANHATMFRQSRVTNTAISTRFPRPDVALVHTTWELVGTLDRDGGTLPPYQSFITCVLTKDGGSWWIASFQNTDIVPPPANMRP